MFDSTHDVNIIHSELAYQGYFKIIRWQLQHRLYAGTWSDTITREVFARGNSVAILLYDPSLRQLVLVEQFRPGILLSAESPWCLELVAGAVEPEQTPEQAAVRETFEEAGLVVHDVIPVLRYWVSPGGSTEYMHLFCGRIDAEQAGGYFGLATEHEDIKVCVLTVADALQKLHAGQINNALTIIGLQWLQLNEAMLRDRWLNK